MKINGILNSAINEVLGKLGHTDSIVIADCGLPIPQQVQCIDLALSLGRPSFSEVLSLLLQEMAVERCVIAAEIQTENREQLKNIQELLSKNNTIPEQKRQAALDSPARQTNIGSEFVPHEEFKVRVANARAVIRTGENTPYSNIILYAGVIF